jgi:hypothetical protein
MLTDEDHVAMILEAQEKFGLKPSEAPPIAEYTPTDAKLDILIDQGRQQAAMFAKANGAKSVPPPKLQPRPETAVDAIRHRKRLAENQRVREAFMPRKYKRDG